MGNDLFFYIGLSLIVLHEIDAIRCKEWRILPGLTKLNDGTGQKVFILAHIPIFILLYLGLSSSFRNDLVFGLNIFFILHLILHIFYLRHNKNKFVDWKSWVLIGGVGLCGFAGLVNIP